MSWTTVSVGSIILHQYEITLSPWVFSELPLCKSSWILQWNECIIVNSKSCHYTHVVLVVSQLCSHVHLSQALWSHEISRLTSEKMWSVDGSQKMWVVQLLRCAWNHDEQTMRAAFIYCTILFFSVWWHCDMSVYILYTVHTCKIRNQAAWLFLPAFFPWFLIAGRSRPIARPIW